MLERLKDIIVQYVDIKPAQITREMSLRADLGLTSLALVSIVLEVEEAFGIEIDEGDIMDFQTLGDVIDYIQAKGGN